MTASSPNVGDPTVRPRLWPALAILPLLIVPSFKAAGFKSLAGSIDLTVVSLLLVLVVGGVCFLSRPSYPLRLLMPLMLVWGVLLVGLWRYANEAVALPDDEKVTGLLISAVALSVVPTICRDDRDLAGLNLVWMLVGGGTAALVLIVGGSESLSGRGGINESYLGPAYLCGLGLVLAATAIVRRSNPLVLTIPTALTCGVALLATGSRGPIVAALGALIAALILSPPSRRKLAALAVTGAVLTAGLTLASSASVTNLTTADTVRPRLATIAVEGFFSSPLVGGGWGSFWLDASSYGYVGIAYPHNLFLEVATEYGIVGLLAVLFMLAVAAARVVRARSNSAAATAGVIVVYWLVGHQFSSDLSDRFLWISLVPCLIIPWLIQERSPTETAMPLTTSSERRATKLAFARSVDSVESGHFEVASGMRNRHPVSPATKDLAATTSPGTGGAHEVRGRGF